MGTEPFNFVILALLLLWIGCRLYRIFGRPGWTQIIDNEWLFPQGSMDGAEAKCELMLSSRADIRNFGFVESKVRTLAEIFKTFDLERAAIRFCQQENRRVELIVVVEGLESKECIQAVKEAA